MIDTIVRDGAAEGGGSSISLVGEVHGEACVVGLDDLFVDVPHVESRIGPEWVFVSLLPYGGASAGHESRHLPRLSRGGDGASCSTDIDAWGVAVLGHG